MLSDPLPKLGTMAARAFLLVILPLSTLAAASGPDVPFRSASVRETGNRFELKWDAPGIHTVKVYTAADPSHLPAGRPAAVGGAQGAAAFTLPGARRWYFVLVPDSGQALTVAPRSLHISAVNARDVGGYRTADGAWVRMGAAFRSNDLHDLTNPSIQTLEALHVRTIVDLRTDTERLRRSDATIPGSTVVDANVLADDREKLAAWFGPHGAQVKPGRVNAMLSRAKDIYRDFVRLPSARSSYHALFVRLANPAALPVLFHCTAGKDRTGWAQAVLLTILGVPRPVIEHDYELSGYYLTASGNALSKSVAAAVSPAEARRIAAADPADLDAAFAEVQRRYGSFDNYLHSGLNLDDATLAAIRTNFLTR